MYVSMSLSLSPPRALKYPTEKLIRTANQQRARPRREVDIDILQPRTAVREVVGQVLDMDRGCFGDHSL